MLNQSLGLQPRLRTNSVLFGTLTGLQFEVFEPGIEVGELGVPWDCVGRLRHADPTQHLRTLVCLTKIWI